MKHHHHRKSTQRHHTAGGHVDMSTPVAKAALRVEHELRGVVVSAGLMDKTVKVRVGGSKWSKIVHKWYADPKHYLVHDSNTSLRTGDVVAIQPGWPTSQHKRHVVKRIIVPFGSNISERPPVPTIHELIAEYEGKRADKDERRATRRATQHAQNKAANPKKEADITALEAKASEEALVSQLAKAGISKAST